MTRVCVGMCTMCICVFEVKVMDRSIEVQCVSQCR